MAEDIRKTINGIVGNCEEIIKSVDRINQRRGKVYCEQCGDKLHYNGVKKNTFMSVEYCDACCEEGQEEEIRQAWEDEKLIGRRFDGRIK